MIDGDGNSGIQFRTQRIPNSHELSGYQADAAVSLWGSLYDESRRARTLGAPKEDFFDGFDDGAWHMYQISAEGRRIRFELDGVQTETTRNTSQAFRRPAAIIGLQIHAWPHPTEVWFANLAIKVL